MSNINGDRAENIVGDVAAMAREKLDEKSQSVNSAIDESADAVSRVAEKTADITHEILDSSRDNISAGLQKATAAVNDVEGAAAEIIKKHPMRTVLLAAALGVVVGFILGVLRND